MTDKCKNCTYLHPLKHNLTRMYGFEHSYACDVLLHIEGGDGWIQEVDRDGHCEAFTEKEKNERI